MCKIELKDAYFLVLLNQKFKKFVSFKWKDLFYFLPLLRSGTSPKDFHKVDENSHLSVESIVCTTDQFSGRYSANGFLKGGTDTSKGNSDTFLSESRFSDKS